MKIKLFLLVSAVILVVIGKHFLLFGAPRESINIFGWLLDLSIAVATVLSIWFIHLSVKKLSATASHNSRIGAYIGAYGIYPFALFLGFIVGTYLGGSIGEIIYGDAGIRGGARAIVGAASSIVVGSFGMFIVTMILCSIFALLGFFLGGIIQVVCKFLMRLLKRCVLSSP